MEATCIGPVFLAFDPLSVGVVGVLAAILPFLLKVVTSLREYIKAEHRSAKVTIEVDGKKIVVQASNLSAKDAARISELLARSDSSASVSVTLQDESTTKKTASSTDVGGIQKTENDDRPSSSAK